MKTSKKELVEMKACKPGLERFIEQTNNTDEDVECVSLVSGENTISNLIWLAKNKLSVKIIVQFAIDCAKVAQQFSDNPKVHTAIQIAENQLKNSTKLDPELYVAYNEALAVARSCSVAARQATYKTFDAIMNIKNDQNTFGFGSRNTASAAARAADAAEKSVTALNNSSYAAYAAAYASYSSYIAVELGGAIGVEIAGAYVANCANCVDKIYGSAETNIKLRRLLVKLMSE